MDTDRGEVIGVLRSREAIDCRGVPCGEANALSIPPEEYGRKVEIQGNWQASAQAAEHVV